VAGVGRLVEAAVEGGYEVEAGVVGVGVSTGAFAGTSTSTGLLTMCSSSLLIMVPKPSSMPRDCTTISVSFSFCSSSCSSSRVSNSGRCNSGFSEARVDSWPMLRLEAGI
jgi:hypothetical protein